MNNLKDNPFKVSAFYSFTALDDISIDNLIEELNILADKNKVLGTILLANEGLNGTICSYGEDANSLIDLLSIRLNKTLKVKESWTQEQAFRRFKVRKKKEIVTMGITNINPNKKAGIYIEPLDWNEYLMDPDTLIIDTRNEYEIKIGSFKNALNPHTRCFRDFPNWVRNKLRLLVKERPPKRIAMFCTGGIRCEKATSLLIDEGFTEIYHLKGGILKYLEEVPKEKSLWNGECFVFDQRVALNNSLLQGEHTLCFACGMPLSISDRKSMNYIKGVQCNYCVELFDDQDRLRFSERQKQYDIKNFKKLPTQVE